MRKDTSELLWELEQFSDFKLFYRENAGQMLRLSAAGALTSLMAEKGLQKSAVVSRSQLSEVYAYQILSGVRPNPSRGKLLCLTLAMGLTLEETQTLLKQTGYAPLYAREPFDCVVIYGIIHGMDVVQVNALLYEYLQTTLE